MDKITRAVSVWRCQKDGFVEWFVERSDRTVSVTVSAEGAVKLIVADDRKTAKRRNLPVMSVVTWHGVPDGFVPPRAV